MHLALPLLGFAAAILAAPHQTPLLIEGAEAAPGAWVALIRGRPWLCWADPSISGNPRDTSCWHELVALRGARLANPCGDDEYEIDAMEAMEATAATAAMEASEPVRSEALLEDDDRENCRSQSATPYAWSFAFAAPGVLWIRTPHGVTYVGRAAGHERAATHLQPSPAPAMLPLQAPRRLSCATTGWLVQHRASQWSWSAQPCTDLVFVSRMRAPTLQQKRQLALRIRLHVTALRNLGRQEPAQLQRSIAGVWTFSLGLHFALDHVSRAISASRIAD